LDLVFGFWCLVFGVWFLVFGVSWLVSGVNGGAFVFGAAEGLPPYCMENTR
jgi:hypothetical protein